MTHGHRVCGHEPHHALLESDREAEQERAQLDSSVTQEEVEGEEDQRERQDCGEGELEGRGREQGQREKGEPEGLVEVQVLREGQKEDGRGQEREVCQQAEEACEEAQVGCREEEGESLQEVEVKWQVVGARVPSRRAVSRFCRLSLCPSDIFGEVRFLILIDQDHD